MVACTQVPRMTISFVHTDECDMPQCGDGLHHGTSHAPKHLLTVSMSPAN